MGECACVCVCGGGATTVSTLHLLPGVGQLPSSIGSHITDGASERVSKTRQDQILYLRG